MGFVSMLLLSYYRPLIRTAAYYWWPMYISGQGLLPARLRGYQAAHCEAIAWATLATLVSFYLVLSHYNKSKQSDTVTTAQANIATAAR